MSDKWLENATRALREQSEDTESAPQISRQRVQQRLADDRRSAARRFAIAVPLIAVLVGSTALAAATGQLPKVWQAVRHWVAANAPEVPKTAPVVESEAGKAAAPKTPTRGQKPREIAAQPLENKAEAVAAPAEAAANPESPAAVAPVPALVAPEVAVPPVEQAQWPRHLHAHDTHVAVHETPPQTAEIQKIVPPAPPPPQPLAPTGPDVLALFRQAQKLHFDQKNWQLALAAWQAYLDAAPNGELAPEARWNRAVCLVRLHKKQKAIQALKPFALAPLGSYRQADALALLEELQDGAAADVGMPEFVP